LRHLRPEGSHSETGGKPPYLQAAWLTGRGWDQERLAHQEVSPPPLDLLFPDVPVLITCVDGHAAGQPERWTWLVSRPNAH
jgi:predicted amidohydrolase YtcJ